MRKTLWVWTGLCATVLVIAFFGSPGWETDPEGWISGEAIFSFLAVLVIFVWLLGLGVLAAVVALVGFLGRDGGIRAWWGRGWPAKASIALLGGACTLAIASAAARTPGESVVVSEFVSFDTVDADPDWSPSGRLIAAVADMIPSMVPEGVTLQGTEVREVVASA